MGNFILITILAIALVIISIIAISSKVNKSKMTQIKTTYDTVKAEAENTKNELDRLHRIISASPSTIIAVDKELEFDRKSDRILTGSDDQNIDVKRLLFSQRKDIESILRDVYISKNKNELLAHLPSIVDHGKQRYMFKYSFCQIDNLVYIFINDVTDFSQKINQLTEWNTSLEMVLQVTKFKQLYAEIIDFFDNKVFDSIEKLFQRTDNIHMFKWEISRLFLPIKENLRQLGMRTSLDNFETLESKFHNLSDLEGLSNAIWDIGQQQLSDIIEDDREKIKLYISEEHYNGKYYFVEQEVLEKIENHAKEMPDSEIKNELIGFITEAKMGEINGIIHEYNDFAKRLSKKYYKKVHPIEVNIDASVANNPYLAYVAKSAFALIDNSIKYGILSPAERFREGKEETGKIDIEFRYEDGHLMLIVEDDGKGLEEDFYETHTVDHKFLNGIHYAELNNYRSTDLHVLASEVGGQIMIECKPNEFTKIILKVKG